MATATIDTVQERQVTITVTETEAKNLLAILGNSNSLTSCGLGGLWAALCDCFERDKQEQLRICNKPPCGKRYCVKEYP